MVSEMAQWVSVCAAKPDNQSLIAEVHILQEENRLLQVAL